MTRKDFIFIAQVIRDMPHGTPEAMEWRERIANRFGDELGATNPRFNRQLFVQAATGIVALTARKAA